MADSWKEMERAKEDEFFNRRNNEALSRLKIREQNTKARLSPITGEPMEQITIHGVIVDRCPKSGYIGLDAGELEQLIKAAKDDEQKPNWFSSLFEGLSTTKR
jgi:hypothetical protein